MKGEERTGCGWGGNPGRRTGDGLGEPSAAQTSPPHTHVLLAGAPAQHAKGAERGGSFSLQAVAAGGPAPPLLAGAGPLGASEVGLGVTVQRHLQRDLCPWRGPGSLLGRLGREQSGDA